MIKVQILLEINGTQLTLSMDDAKELSKVLADLTGSNNNTVFNDPTTTLYRNDGLNEKVEAARERAKERTSGCGTERNTISKEMLRQHREEMQAEIDRNRERLFELGKKYSPDAMVKNIREVNKHDVKPGCGTKNGGRCG
jgi:hypothetical protein